MTNQSELFSSYYFCTDFTDDDWNSLNLARSVTAMPGAVVILVILSFLIYYKVYSTLFQRLYLYLVTATLLNEMSSIFSIEHQWQYVGKGTVSRWIGFFHGWTFVLLFIYSYEIIVYLVYLVVSKIYRGSQHPQCGKGCTMSHSVITETVYFLLPAFIATAFSLPPYMPNSYGIAGPWCSARSLDDECQPSSMTLQMLLCGMYIGVGVVGIVASLLVFLILYCRLTNHFREVRYLWMRTLYLLAFKFVHILITLGSFACHIYMLNAHCHQMYGLWLLHELAVPLGVLVFPLGYLLCFHDLAPIVHIVKEVACKGCKQNASQNSTESQRLTSTLPATVPGSNRITQPSYTFFVVPHPSESADI